MSYPKAGYLGALRLTIIGVSILLIYERIYDIPSGCVDLLVLV